MNNFEHFEQSIYYYFFGKKYKNKHIIHNKGIVDAKMTATSKQNQQLRCY